MALRVNVEHLAVSGVAVTNHGETVAAEHAAADGRIASAHAGWRGLSAVALVVKSATWTETTAALLSRLSDHAQGLHNGAVVYSEGEAHSTRTMEQVAAQGDAAAAKAAKRL